MHIIDNVNDLLGDDLKAEVQVGSKLRIAASTFSIFAFEALRKELERVEELEFVFTSPSFVAAAATDQLPKNAASSSFRRDRTGSRRSTDRNLRSACATS